MKTLITGAKIVNEGKIYNGSVVIENGFITEIITDKSIINRQRFDNTVNAAGCFLLPGVIDDHVHFREPGLTAKADIKSESRAAAYGGVTSYFDMPNTIPQTVSLEALEDKRERARRDSYVNYSFFFGATDSNTNLFSQLDIHRTPGIKLFMGSSTGNMLVEKEDVLDGIFKTAPLPIMTHCEATDIINRNMKRAVDTYGNDPDVTHHPEIRSEEACFKSTDLAVKLAKKHGTRLHVAHITTAKELSLFEKGGETLPRITAEAVTAHLVFTDNDYRRLGTKIKCNPAIKTKYDREELIRALADGRISVVGTDHAPHLPSDKRGGCVKAASGMPIIQFSLVTMLELTNKGALTIERLVELMCHNPAKLFNVRLRGFIRPGYKADIAIVRPDSRWTVTKECIQSKCGWSPLEGHEFSWRVEHTFCNGNHIYNNGHFDTSCRGEEILFR